MVILNVNLYLRSSLYFLNNKRDIEIKIAKETIRLLFNELNKLIEIKLIRIMRK